MPADKYTATWVSYSSMRDFLNCPRLYFLRNVYKDPDTNRKMTIMTPPLALGQAVHEVVESLSVIPVETRFKTSLIERLQIPWKKVTGEQGGFSSESVEQEYRARAEDMLRRIMDHPGPLANLAVKIHQDLPHYYLSEDDNIILCGKIDWLEYLSAQTGSPEEKAVGIIDFKTGKGEEDGDSLQLPSYILIASNTQKFPVAQASYWYIEREDEPRIVPMPDIAAAREKIVKIAKDISLARKLNRFKCPQGNGCRQCQPYEMILQKKGKLVGQNDFGQDVYVVDPSLMNEADMSTIL